MQNRKTDGINFIKRVCHLVGIPWGSVTFQWIWSPWDLHLGIILFLPLLITTLFCFPRACGMCSIWICLLIRMCWRHLPALMDTQPPQCCREPPYQVICRQERSMAESWNFKRKTKWECQESKKYIINMDRISVSLKMMNYMKQKKLLSLDVKFVSF